MNRNIAAFFLSLTLLVSFNCFAGELFTFKPNGFDIIVNSVASNHTYQSAGIKVLSPGYQVANAGIDCSNHENGFCLFQVSDTQPKILRVLGALGAYEFSLCLDGINQLSCQRYLNSSLTPNKYAYIGNFYSGLISICPINEDDEFETCTTATSLGTNPTSTTIDLLNKRIYFATASGTVHRCNVNTTTGALTSCVSQNMSVGSLQSIKLNTLSTRAYLANINGQLYLCDIDASDGSLKHCMYETSTPNTAWGMALTQNKLFIANTNEITKCNVDQKTGELSQCSQALGGFNNATAIILNPQHTLAYISDCGANDVFKCSVSPSGVISQCVPSESDDFVCPYRAMLNNKNTAIYIANFSGSTVTECSIDEDDGSITNCADTENEFNGPSNGDLL